MWAEGIANTKARGWKELGRRQHGTGEVGKIIWDFRGFSTEVIFTKVPT